MCSGIILLLEQKESDDGLQKNEYIGIKKIIKSITCFIIGFALGIFLSYKFLFLVCANKDRRITMFSEYFYTLDKWLKLNRKQYLLNDYLLKKGYRNIAIYGIGVMGKQLIADLQNGEIQIIYAIDQKSANSSYHFPIKTLDDTLENVDVIIVTPSYEFYEIKENLESKVLCPIVSLHQLIEGWYEEKNQ